MKNIILCSDGTGNRWGVGSQTNVSKLYEAVETDEKKTAMAVTSNSST